ncbi:MAG: ABC transporter permease [Treponema sp.]|jgi:peptide/nickel transport system permease protein|nr:ABC transporter permease [Treponema sp.]
MAALGFVLKRLAELAVSMAVLSFLTFSLLYLAPGDPAKVLLGTRRQNPEALAAIRARYHLDEPLLRQYGIWLTKALRLDFGDAIRTGDRVTRMAASALPATLTLVCMALAVSVSSGVILGAVSATRRGGLLDKTVNLAALTGTSAPSFAVGLLFLYVFAVLLGWFPVYGIGNGGFVETLRHLALPALTLSCGISAMLIKITRAAMLSEVNRDYGVFMRARSISNVQVTLAQLRNASGPILTGVGLLLASLFGSTVLVETTFALPGIGGLLASSVIFKDIPVVQFLTLALAFFICLTQAAVDIGIYFLDPQRGAGEEG